MPHQVYRKAWIDSWIHWHPDWEYRFWTDQDNERLVREQYPSFLKGYLELTPPIKKADFVRLLYMHHYGGVYVDLDFLCFKNVSPLLNDYEIVLGRLSPRNRCYQIPNAFLASTPGCPFWINIASEVIAAPQEEQDRIERHTGPLRLESAYYKYEPEGAVVHPQELIYPLDWIDLVCTDTMREANALREKSPEELTTLFPRSYCISFWMHNWQRM